MAYEAHFAGPDLAENLLGDDGHTDQAASPDRSHHHHTVIAFVGMAFEARIAAGPGVLVFPRDSRRELAAAARNAARHGYRGIISFGVAGGLASALRAGDWVVASTILDSGKTVPTDGAWSGRLRDAIKGSHYAPILGVDNPVAATETKQLLHRTTGAVAVDMESHVVARVAEEHGLAFTALRVIVDPAHRAIPRAALLGMGTGSRANGAAVLRDLVARPSQLSLLMRVTLDAYIARCAMQRVRSLLGPHFGLTELAAATTAASEAIEDLASVEVGPYRSPA